MHARNADSNSGALEIPNTALIPTEWLDRQTKEDEYQIIGDDRTETDRSSSRLCARTDNTGVPTTTGLGQPDKTVRGCRKQRKSA